MRTKDVAPEIALHRSAKDCTLITIALAPLATQSTQRNVGEYRYSSPLSLRIFTQAPARARMMTSNRLFLLCVIAFALVPALTSAQPVDVGGVKITLIDVEQLLAKRFNINPDAGRYAEDNDCPNHPTGGGFRAKTWCHHYTQFRDLVVESVAELTVGSVDLSKLPVSRRDEQVEFENYWPEPYHFQQTVTYKSHQGATVTLSEVLTKVKDYSSTFDVNATLFKSIGIVTSDKVGNSISYSLTHSTTQSLDQDFEIVQPLDFSVPSCVKRWATYSDEKRNISIPLHVKGLIGGRIVDWVPESRTETEIRKIDYNTKEDRSIDLDGYLELAGSNRSLSVKLGQENLTDGNCAPRK